MQRLESKEEQLGQALAQLAAKEKELADNLKRQKEHYDAEVRKQKLEEENYRKEQDRIYKRDLVRTEEMLRKKEAEQERELERAKREHAELLAKQAASHSHQFDRALQENEEKLKKFQELHDHKQEKHAEGMPRNVGPSFSLSLDKEVVLFPLKKPVR